MNHHVTLPPSQLALHQAAKERAMRQMQAARRLRNAANPQSVYAAPVSKPAKQAPAYTRPLIEENEHVRAYTAWRSIIGGTGSMSEDFAGLCYLAGVKPDDIRAKGNFAPHVAIRKSIVRTLDVRYPGTPSAKLGKLINRHYSTVLDLLGIRANSKATPTRPQRRAGARLTSEQAEVIRDRYWAGQHPKALAEEYKCSPSNIYKIVQRQSFKETGQ